MAQPTPFQLKLQDLRVGLVVAIESRMSATHVFGIVHELDEEWVETEFDVVAGFPITPQASYYRRGPDQRYEIPTQPLSLLKVYLSYHAGLAAFLCLGSGALLPPATALSDGLLCVGTILALLCAFARLRIGKLTQSERQRRLIHRQVTGISALPAFLPERLVKNLLVGLETQWKRNWKRWNATKDWHQSVDADRDADTLALLAVLSTFEHAVEGDDAHAALSAKAWKLLDAAGGSQALESLSPDEAMAVMEPEAPAVEVPAAKKICQRKKRVPREKKASRGIKIRCERCESVSRVPEACAGHTGLCPTCKKPIRVPGKESLRVARAA
jgi:hypothetical protein